MNKLLIASAFVASFSTILVVSSPVRAQNVAATVSATGANVDIGNALVGFDSITVGAAINVDGLGSAFSTSTIASTDSAQNLDIGALGVVSSSTHSSDTISSTAAANADPLSSLIVTVGSSSGLAIVDLATPEIGVGVAEETIDVEALY
ncbi:hypothetical protein GS597_18390 [Synechococcales cyanobacterium C]|uniref:Uncharacterized protein n=1 Tax=Petrachloros mirabilis ULC683 TaxID=2781853 RepID=A0A8K2A9Q7_9CYAN|nr:hypothetical protein [Petrachloros mirabilis]NCJ08440.1 hypothetical protein [Petrachloros mirabilis ULC683]